MIYDVSDKFTHHAMSTELSLMVPYVSKLGNMIALFCHDVVQMVHYFRNYTLILYHKDNYF